MCGWHCDRGMFSFAEGVSRWHNRVATCAPTLVADRYPPFRLGHDPAPGSQAGLPPIRHHRAPVWYMWHDDGPPADPGTVAASFMPRACPEGVGRWRKPSGACKSLIETPGWHHLRHPKPPHRRSVTTFLGAVRNDGRRTGARRTRRLPRPIPPEARKAASTPACWIIRPPKVLPPAMATVTAAKVQANASVELAAGTAPWTEALSEPSQGESGTPSGIMSSARTIRPGAAASSKRVAPNSARQPIARSYAAALGN